MLGLIVLFVFFSLMKPETFFTTFNFANLLNQSAAIIVLAMGLVFVLLLGEIDLSAGFTAGTAAAVLAVSIASWGVPWPAALVLGLLTGTVIGLLIGLLVARLGIPSFVVTLAMFLALQGVMLLIIGEGGTIRLRSDELLAVMNKNLPLWAGWLLWAVVVLGYAFVSWRAISGRRKAGLKSTATSVWAAKTIALAVLLGVAVFLLNQERRSSGRARSRARPTVRRCRAASRSSRVFRGPSWWCLSCWSGSPSCRDAPRSAGTSTRSAATPRRRAGPASTSR